MTLQEQLRKLTRGGPGVTHIASETLFDDSADHIDALERIIESWKREEAEWTAERDALQARVRELQGYMEERAHYLRENGALRAENESLRGFIELSGAIPHMTDEQLEQLRLNAKAAISAGKYAMTDSIDSPQAPLK